MPEKLILLPTLILLSVVAALQASTPTPQTPITETRQLLDATGHRADALFARSDLSAYRGWLKYLRFVAERELTSTNAPKDVSNTNVARFADWVGRIETDPGVLGSLRGVQEWAYESPVDDSGQPFRLNIPTDYDPARPAGVVVYLHGNGGNHIEHSGWLKPHPGMFDLAALGRGRGVGYEGLGEADVLDAIQYVEQHWRIDANRVHLNGSSMGGMGVFNLGADYPHLWASGEINFGILVARPPNDLLTLPVYALHSQDDWSAPIITARAAMSRLRQLGGQVVFEETNGYGHGFADEGYQRAGAWRERQVRPDSRQVRHLDFIALSGTAARDWWAEILEWGPRPRPAHFVLTAGRDNTLYAELSNITRLNLRLAESPFDPGQPLSISVGGAKPFQVTAPLPSKLVLFSNAGEWQAETNTVLPPFRFHTPGGPSLLYDGSPLLIVYGTSGPTNICQKLRASAEAASKMGNPGFAYEDGGSWPDGIPNYQNLYGRLRVKPDQDVTETDLQRCQLVLLGTEDQNRVVKRLAPQLPVRWAANKLSCSDGLELGGTNRLITLVHYNPLAPRHLLWWVASDTAEGYSGAGSFARPGADFIAADLVQDTLMVARSFDSRWNWEAARASSPLLPPNLVGKHDLDMAANACLWKANGADYLFAFISTNNAAQVALGTTRLADGLAFTYYQPMGYVDLSGTELLQAERRRKSEAKQEYPTPLYPSFDPTNIFTNHTYRIAFGLDDFYSLAQTFKLTTRSVQLTDHEVTDILERSLLPAEVETRVP
jgi:predicted esterase